MLRKGSMFLLLSLACVPSASAEGINLNWTECGLNGKTIREFACDTNSGSHRLVASYRPPAGIDSLAGLVGIIDLCFNGQTVPSWWMMKNAGTCRPTSITYHPTPTVDPIGCSVRWEDGVTGTLNYQIGHGGWDEIRMIVQSVASNDPGTPLDPNEEYFAFAIEIDNAKTVGVDACVGCDLPACIVLNGVMPLMADGSSAWMTQPDRGYMAAWQEGIIGCPFIVPTRQTSWGSIKALYR